MRKIYAAICATGLYLPINLWYPGRNCYYSFSELYKAFSELYMEALGGK